MKRVIPAASLLLFAAVATASLQGEKPQPVDSARSQENPEQREPPKKPMPPLADDKRGDVSTKSFEQLDENKDGKLSKDELGADEAEGMDFSKIDRDGDGTISRDEWNAHWSGRHDKH
ncbi:MAG TPA: EF-hand domain-containing protein [Tahibacter sp.]|uniref:EF-hand domain-containing protein n=1 Tax=Tahibacter sp. TaxID=2056211 RepID=UPI002CBB1EDE|nr:EF-hand domain-containing protein [Tahibacter sp.]HSX61026.1 EF-hand domain-containing protein [Tahibacter sp.]